MHSERNLTGTGVGMRSLRAADLDAIVAIDRVSAGHPRRDFFARRLEHAAREPEWFVALGAERGGRLVGFAFARIEEGAFGAAAQEGSLDALGVDPATMRQHGVGRRLIEGLTEVLGARGIRSLATQVEWTEAALLGFFARTGFVLAPRLVLARASADPVAPVDAEGVGPARDRWPIRSMTRADLPWLVEIDRRITGRARPGYYARKLEEAFTESAVRMSLVAEIDDRPAGFIMARVDFGEFGQTEPEAVMDTIGIDPRRARQGIAAALLSQLMVNLGALRAERVRTEVDWNHFSLLGFLDRMGFGPHRRLALRRGIDPPPPG